MINRIIVSSLFISMLFALALSLMNVQAPVKLSEPFLRFLTRVSYDADKYKLLIPDIPHIPLFDRANSSGWDIKDFLNGIFQFINALINILNFLVLLINEVISLVEFLFFMVKDFITMRDDIVAQIAVR